MMCEIPRDLSYSKPGGIPLPAAPTRRRDSKKPGISQTRPEGSGARLHSDSASARFLPRAHLPWTLGRKKRASGSGRAAGIQTSAHSMTMDNDDSLMLDEKSAPPGGTQNGAGVNGTANGANETVWCVECEDVAASLKCVPRQPWGAKTPCAGP